MSPDNIPPQPTREDLEKITDAVMAPLPTDDQYNDLLDATEQIDMEEAIASELYDEQDEAEPLDEESAANLSRRILKLVLKKFRPDLFCQNSA